MRDVNHGSVQLLVQLGDLQTHFNPQLCVKVGQWFVEKKNFRIADNGATDGDALSLTTGQILWFAIQQFTELKCVSCSGDFLFDNFFINTVHAQAEAHVFSHRHVGVERIRLEYHSNSPINGSDVGDVIATDVYFAVAEFFESGNHSQ